MKVFVFNVSTFSNIERNYEGLYFVYFNFSNKKKILCWVIHPPTFQPPADGARSLASSPVKGFYRR